jgi:hypothetical protein
MRIDCAPEGVVVMDRIQPIYIGRSEDIGICLIVLLGMAGGRLAKFRYM